MNSSLQEWLIIGKCWIINLRDKSMCSSLVTDPAKLGWADSRSGMSRWGGTGAVAGGLDAGAGISHVLFHTFASRMENIHNVEELRLSAHCLRQLEQREPSHCLPNQLSVCFCRQHFDSLPAWLIIEPASRWRWMVGRRGPPSSPQQDNILIDRLASNSTFFFSFKER